VAKMRAVAEEVRDLVAEFGGANSSEHGDGLARSEFNRSLFGDELYEAMRRVKSIFDPDGRMNPGKIVDAPSMTENLREPALPPPGPLTTALDFTVVAGGGPGVRGAAGPCQNTGLCRQGAPGGGCPSHQAAPPQGEATPGRG